MFTTYSNVNDAFEDLTDFFQKRSTFTVETDSRNGPVKRCLTPLTIGYSRPDQRVLFNAARDANPFFHVYESLWMLMGENEVDSPAWFAKNLRNYSDDGKTLHGAYGYRWRRQFGFDQLSLIADELGRVPTSRRCYLQMWDADGRGSNDLFLATSGGKDVPCNVGAVFEIIPVGESECLQMTVFNRSNDLVWGTLGANVVHFSFLQEYTVARINAAVDNNFKSLRSFDKGNLLLVGPYYQISTNQHVYLNNFEPEAYKCDHRFGDPEEYDAEFPNRLNLVDSVMRFTIELGKYIRYVQVYAKKYLDDTLNPVDYLPTTEEFEEPFLSLVAVPVFRSYVEHKKKRPEEALNWAKTIASDDWRLACVEWLNRRNK